MMLYIMRFLERESRVSGIPLAIVVLVYAVLISMLVIMLTCIYMGLVI